MTQPIGGRAAAPVPASPDAKLKGVATQLEGVFVQQLYQAMRQTVDDEGFAGGGSAEQSFTAMMDERVAADTPQKWSHGLSEALYRQLRAAAAAHAPAPPVSDR